MHFPMVYKRLVSYIIPLITVVSISAQVPKYSNEFLSVGIGARALGMANCVVASVGDVTAGYWNPSGLNNLSGRAELGLMHSEYFAGIAKFDYGGFALRIDENSVAGLSVIRFGVDDIPNTLELIDRDGNIRYDRISKFSAADYGFLFSYARKSAIEGLQYGGNVKVIYRKTGEFANAYGFGFDVGARYTMGKWQFGATGRDITSTFNAWSFNTSELEEVFALTGNELPENSLEMTMPRIIVGAARKFMVSEKFGILAAMDADFTFDGKRHTLVSTPVFSIDPHLGVELDYNQVIFLRLGMGNIQIIPEIDKNKSFDFQPTLGIGIKLKNFLLDYALTDIGDQSIALYSNIFSLRYIFNLPELNKL